MNPPRRPLPPLDPLKGFVAAARHLSFTKAGEALCLSQSAVSRQIQTLEEQLGIRLFERNTRNLRLTPAGEKLYRCAADCLDQLAAVVREITAPGQAPHVTVSATISFAALWLLPRLSAFQARHPEIAVRLSTENRQIDLDAEDIDLAIRYAEPDQVPPGTPTLFGERLVPVASPALAARLGHPPRLDADTLAQVTLLTFDDGRGYRWLHWEHWLGERRLNSRLARAELQFNLYDQCIYAALAGQGIAIGRLPLIGDLLADGRLVAIGPETPAPAGRGYYLLQRTLGERPEVGLFRNWLQSPETLGNNLAPSGNT